LKIADLDAFAEGAAGSIEREAYRVVYVPTKPTQVVYNKRFHQLLVY